MHSPSPSRFLIFAALLLSVLAAPRGAWASIKLCMKDGSYQMVTSYEVQGDRVRYFSVERSDWEEVPASLVDFEATKRAQDEAKATEKKRLEEAKQLDQERFYKPPDQGLEVAPGLHLPGDDGIFTVDGRRVVRLVQSSGKLQCAPREESLNPLLLDKVVEYIGTHIGRSISLADLAKVANTSPFHFSRLFKNATGMSPHAFVLSRRTTIACQLLEEGVDGLAIIATKSGFSSQSHMGRAFKKMLKVSPAAYRQQSKV